MTDLPQWAMEKAMAAQNAAEAECQKERYVYSFGTGNAKEVLDKYIARALVEAEARGIERATEFLEDNHTIISGEPLDPIVPEIIASIRKLKETE